QRTASAEIGDFIVRREDGGSSFFFCNAVDDALMGVTHVLRGDDHLTNTPRQLLVLDALGLRRPAYGHVGLLVGVDGAPLSKRHGGSSVQEFRQRGFLAPALLNHLFRLGHAADIDGWLEPAAMSAHFRPEHLGKAPARFEETQLVHWQKETLAHMSLAAVRAWLRIAEDDAFIDLIRHNVVLPEDASVWAEVVHGEVPAPGVEEQRVLAGAGGAFFAAAVAALDECGTDLKRLARRLAERTGRRGADLYLPLRLALTGRGHGPELGPLLTMIGTDTARRRLERHAQDP
ncbi:MAG: glutamate--tRNA ligase, partial [Gammaproteobacteria bacterium]|nr:glutamate--tRNA ligase [Gammaproteobacteria bacterium]